MSNNALNNRTDWAEDDEPDLTASLPPPQITRNKDGSETIVTVSLNEEGKRVKRTQRIKKTTIRKYEKPSVAERRQWTKFGPDEAARAVGPHASTTTVGENIVFRPQMGFKPGGVQEKSAEEVKKEQAIKSMAIKCRICQGDHFTTKCPFRDTMAPEGEAGAGHADLGADAGKETLGALNAGTGMGGGAGGSSYVPPHLRKGGAGTGERMGGKYERDDLATLRVTNVSEFAEEDEMRALFDRFGRVTRVFLAKDRDTGRAKGFAFVSFLDRADAAKALDKLDGYGYHHLILKVEFAKKST